MGWQQRNDSVQGYIYLFRAVGFHGWLPGAVLGRYKIGLSRNPEARLDTFHSNQPPCNLEIVRIIEVEDMGETESLIHQQFKASNVKLTKSREWFDLMPWQVVMVHLVFNRHEIKRSRPNLPVKAIAGGLIALLGVGMLLGQGLSQPAPPQQVQQIKIK
ncbi:MAG: GIY-YIG nuclease family protein [Spirirestis rafaelensis WJT71-NPBG6]|jgi:hypothetical protein|nr:GIY-YIG nuclease family protein [Spirirestis rafaelensis WJT71-NPBG6]